MTVSLAPEDVTVTAFRPCDWVNSDEASSIFGWPSATAMPFGDHPGSVSQSCQYSGGGNGQLVTSDLMLTGSVAADAQGELDLVKGDGPGSDVSVLSGPAYCATAHGGKGSSMLIVLLSGGRAYHAMGWDSGQTCDQLKQFAHEALQRIPS